MKNPKGGQSREKKKAMKLKTALRGQNIRGRSMIEVNEGRAFCEHEGKKEGTL